MRRKTALYRVLLAVAFLAFALAPPALRITPWDWVISAIPAAGAFVGAVVAIEKAGATEEAAERAHAAKDAAERAAGIAHLALAFHARPTAYVAWQQRVCGGHEQWVLLPRSTSGAVEVRGEWHFSDGRPHLTAFFREIDPQGHPLGQPDPELVVPTGIPGTVPITQLHSHLVYGRLEYTDMARLAVWCSEWRFKAPREEQITLLEGSPNADFTSGLVRLLSFPTDLQIRADDRPGAG